MIAEARVRSIVRVGSPGWAIDTCALGLLTCVLGAAYWFVAAPLYNPPGSIDPWVYTALFTNFDFIYGIFSNTYYASRLPWVVPGLLSHEVFSDRVAFVVLHVVFFLAGAIAAFVVVRRFLGRLAAFVAYAVLVGNQLYFNAHDWDYVDGAVVTYLLVAFALGLSCARGGLRLLSLWGCGFFLAAAIATNLFVVVLAVGFPIFYAAVNPLRGSARQIVVDAAAFAVGSVTLLVFGGLFAESHGADFWFLGPQFRAVREIDNRDYRTPNFDWIVHEPRLLAPLLVLLAGAVLLPFVPRREPADRRRAAFAVAAYAYLLFTEVFLVGWQLAGGAALEYAWYASLQLPALALAVGGVTYAASTASPGRRARLILLVLAVAAAASPLLVVYEADWGSVVGSTGTTVTIGIGATLLAIALAGHALRRRSGARTIAAIAVVILLAFGVNFSMAASQTVFVYGASSPANGEVYDMGMGFIQFMRGNGFQRELPYFWYRRADAPELTGIQSLYYFAYTYLGTEMPRIDSAFRARASSANPRLIVLLCVRASCHGGPRALRSLGYRLQEASRTRLSSGSSAVWARVFRVEHEPQS